MIPKKKKKKLYYLKILHTNNGSNKVFLNFPPFHTNHTTTKIVREVGLKIKHTT